MSINEALACGDMPHSSASSSKLVRGLTRKFEQELSKMVEQTTSEPFTPVMFRRALGGLGDLLAGIGREAVQQIVEDRDLVRSSIEVDGCRLRYRDRSRREWLTPFGRISVQRRTYRGNGAGALSRVPLDEMCGMQERFMTPEVEEMVAFGMAMLTAREVEQLLAKTLPEGPSATAIQTTVRRLGAEVDARRSDIEDSISEERPLSDEGDVLAVSWDGVMTPMREDRVAWREAGVATVSVYGQGDEAPEKLDTRYLARMPESGMKSLIASVVDQVVRATSRRTFRDLVVICDGKDSIWSAANAQPALTDAVWILDFYHASENLMKAASAIFGDSPEAARWHEKLRRKLQIDQHGVDKAIRSMKRYRRLIPSNCKKQAKVVKNAIAYFRFHRDRMRYASFIARGLPIGSGPVESAAKNIVQARLKRSGMSWSHEGGQHVLDLRSFLKSDRWDNMWSTITKAA